MEGILIRIEGLISLVVDVEHQRVTMRTLSYVTAKQIAEAIDRHTEYSMEARLVTKNKFNQEFLVKLVRIITFFKLNYNLFLYDAYVFCILI